MTILTFWEKPGCAGNARQKAALRAAGLTLDVRDLTAERWTSGRLRGFFGKRPVATWFNPRAPRVVSGAVKPDALSEDAALALLISDPLLIRRPLIEAAPYRDCGYDPQRIGAAMGVALDANRAGEACPRQPRTQ